jgi:hypothetical protein
MKAIMFSNSFHELATPQLNKSKIMAFNNL